MKALCWHGSGDVRVDTVPDAKIEQPTDAGTKDALQFLMTREITHMKAFTAALESLGKDRFTIGRIPPSKDVVNKYFNDSTGEGELGRDATGPWNTGGDWQMEEAPAIKALKGKK